MSRTIRFQCVPVATLAVALGVLFVPAALAAQATPLEVGETLSGTLATGDTLLYSFEAGDDYFLYGEANQISVDVVVALLDDEGDVVATFDSPARGTEAFTRMIREAGSYTLRVAPFEEEEGDFTIRIDMLEPKADDPEDLADQLMFAYDRPGGPGGAVRVWRDGRTLFSEEYGLADLTWNAPFEQDTPTNIGSTSKQFTAFAIMLEEEAGRLSLSDPIRDYFPDFPEFTEGVTIENLLTHTSGLREFLNLYAVTGMDTRALNRDDVLRAVERQPALQNEPGGEWNYNNTAFSLAAQIVEQTSGRDFDDYMREEVFEPLGMTNSYARMESSQVIPRRSDGYTPAGSGWTAPGDLGGAIGAGGIYASVEDLERWGMNMLEPRVGTPEMVERMMTEFTLNDGEGTSYGYGLFVDEQRGLKRVHHGGADVSHRSMIVYYPEIEAGLTVQSNASTFNSQGTAFELGAAWFGDEMEPEEPPVAAPEPDAEFDPADFDLADFERYAGAYTLDPAPQITARFWVENDTIWTQLTGQPKVEMQPTGPARFKIVPVDATVQFAEGDPAPGFTLYQSGQEVPGTRVEAEEGDESADEVWSPEVEDFEAFVGRYYADETETFFTVRIEHPEEGEEGEPRLVLNQLRMGDMTLTPSPEEDSFAAGGLSVSFERDRNGMVIGAYVDAGRTRDVRFARVR